MLTRDAKLKSLSVAAGLLASCCLAVSLTAGETITCQSPDGKFADSGDNRWKFELPREGRTVVVRARNSGKVLHKLTWDGEKFQEQK